MKTAIGIDVSKESLDVCVYRKGAKPRHRKFRNSDTGHRELVDWVLRQSGSEERHFCLESTGCYGFGIAAYLADGGHLVSVENARPVKHFAIAAKLKAKTDKTDAYCIARYCAVMEPREWTLKDPLQRELFSTRTRLRQIDRMRRAEVSRLEDRHLPEFIRQQIQETVAHFDRQTKDAQAHVKELMSRCEEAHTVYKAVTGINGAGPETGLLMSTVDILSFHEAPNVAVYFGLNPRLCQSGKFFGQTRISKCGDAAGRATLMSAANAAVKSNDFFKQLHEKLLERGLKKKQALAAVARKLVMIAWAIARNALLGLPVIYPGGELRNKNLRVYCQDA
jgi:transposase